MKKRMGILKRKTDNRGSAIVTVIVVTTFITIIATTVLYISARNYQTKQVAYQNTKSFYQAEEALDTLKALLAQDVSDAFMYAYADTMANYVEYGSDINNYYAKSFTNQMKAYWVKRCESYSSTDTEKNLKAVKKYMAERISPDGTEAGLTEEQRKMIECITSVGDFQIPPEYDKYVITGVKASYTSDSGYSTYISVDIGLEVPKLELDKANTSDSSVNITDCVKYMNWKKD